MPQERTHDDTSEGTATAPYPLETLVYASSITQFPARSASASIEAIRSDFPLV